MAETPALSFTRSIDSPLTSCFQHFIYIEAVRTSTRGLWTPIKLYFVQSSKWSDHKPSNRGINSQYWPDFQLRPAPMASFQNFEDRPLAQTFARLEKANEARRLFLFYKCEQKKNVGGISRSITVSDALDDCLDRSIKRSLVCSVWTEDLVRAFRVVLAMCLFAIKIFFECMVWWTRLFWQINMDTDGQSWRTQSIFLIRNNEQMSELQETSHHILFQ